MKLSTGRTRRAVRAGALLTGLVAALLPLAACGGDQAAGGPEPTGVSIAPSSAASHTSVMPTPTPVPTTSGAASKPATEPSIARSETIRDAVGAVGVAESAVADSATVEVSKDDDASPAVWEVTVRTGDEGRELRIATDGSVLSNEPETLSAAQQAPSPKVDVTKAIKTAQQRVSGEVTDAELTTENGQRVWDVSVEASGDQDWELWIDASSGKVLRQQRD